MTPQIYVPQRQPFLSYAVRESAKQPLLSFILESLEACGCTIITHSGAKAAPFRVSFVTPEGQRVGIVAYAFYANQRETHNRPDDEWRFQLKYGSKTSELHEIWQDPFGLYVTLFVGISPERGFFVGADPVLNNPTPFFISKEFKDAHVDAIFSKGWHAWERTQREGSRKGDAGAEIEVLVGGTPHSFLRYVQFEREVRGEDQGHRQLVAEQFQDRSSSEIAEGGVLQRLSSARAHELAAEFQLDTKEILDLIQSAPRLKVAVRGWVAEQHLFRLVKSTPGVSECKRIEEDGRPDLQLRYRKSREILIECKNILRQPDAQGNARLQLMKSRHSKTDPCRRYYDTDEFDIVAACLHAQTSQWEFRSRPTAEIAAHSSCKGKLSHLLTVDLAWSGDLEHVFQRVLD